MTTVVTEGAKVEPVVEQPKTVGDTLYPDGDVSKTAEQIAAEAAAASETPEAKEAREASEAAAAKKITDDAAAAAEAAKKNETPEAKAAREAAEAAAAKAKTVPEKYDFKAPEGMTLDDAEVGKFSELARKAQLDQTTAQELVDFHFETLKKAGIDLVAAQQKQWTDIQNAWKTEIDKDAELGAQKTEVTTRIGKLLDEYGTKEAREAFDTTGAGNNPAVIRLLNNVAKKLVEAGPRSQGKPAGQAKARTLGGVLYPTETKDN